MKWINSSYFQNKGFSFNYCGHQKWPYFLILFNSLYLVETKTIRWKLDWKLWTSVLWSDIKAVQFQLCSNTSFLSFLRKCLPIHFSTLISKAHILCSFLNIKQRENPQSVRRSVSLNTAHIFALIQLHTFTCSQLKKADLPKILQRTSHLNLSGFDESLP